MSKTTYVLRGGELVEKPKPEVFTEIGLLPNEGRTLAAYAAFERQVYRQAFGVRPRD